jgi:hypothetical protein
MSKQAQIKSAKRQSNTFQAYKNVFNTPDGEIVLKDMMFHFGVLRDNFTGDVNLLLVREGERRVILSILEKLSVDVEGIKERIDKYANEE